MTFYKFGRFDMMRDTGYNPESSYSMSQSNDAMVFPCTNSSLSFSALSIELSSILRSIVIVLGLSILSLVSLVIILA